MVAHSIILATLELRLEDGAFKTGLGYPVRFCLILDMFNMTS